MRFVWAVPAVIVNVASMTDVASTVCRGAGLAVYPLRTCTAATLAIQVPPLPARTPTVHFAPSFISFPPISSLPRHILADI